MTEILDISSEDTSEGIFGDEIPLFTFRIIGCTFVTLFVGLTLIVYVSSGMFHVDCLTQICCESCIFVGYMLLLLTTVEPYKINTNMCLIIAIFLHFLFVSASFFLLLEVICMCQVLTIYFPKKVQVSVKNVLLVGFGSPAIITGLTAIVNHRDFTTKRNCWVRVDQTPYWSSLVPMMICSCIQIILILLISLSQVPLSVPASLFNRAKCYRTTRWASLCVTVMLCLSWSLGVRAYHTGDESFYAAFVVASIFLGVCIFTLRISTDSEIRKTITLYVLCCLIPKNRVLSSSDSTLLRKKFSASSQDTILAH